MPPKQKAVSSFDLEAIVRASRDALAKESVLRLTGIQPKQARDQVVARLRADGFEVTRSVVRRPLAEQLAESLDQGAVLSLSALGSHVGGGTSVEAKRAALELVARGSARRVLRGKADNITATSTPTASRDELTRLRVALDTLRTTIARALRTRTTTLLRSDITDALHAAWSDRPMVRPPTQVAATLNQQKPERAEPPGSGSEIESILAAVDAANDARSGLSFVPDVVKRLDPVLDAASARRALLAAASSGLLELRPEGGLHRLSEADLALCPPGPQGTRLSWARRVHGEQR
jgi:hypothetical protein